MRISDWSSDVCSSDLLDAQRLGQLVAAFGEALRAMLQHGLACPRLVFAPRFRGLNRGGDRLLGGFCVRHGDARGDLAPVLVAHVPHLLRRLWPCCVVVRVVLWEHCKYLLRTPARTQEKPV